MESIWVAVTTGSAIQGFLLIALLIYHRWRKSLNITFWSKVSGISVILWAAFEVWAATLIFNEHSSNNCKTAALSDFLLVILSLLVLYTGCIANFNTSNK